MTLQLSIKTLQKKGACACTLNSGPLLISVLQETCTKELDIKMVNNYTLRTSSGTFAFVYLEHPNDSRCELLP